MGLLDKLFGARSSAPASRPALPANSKILANDLVIAALIGPPGHPVEDIIARAAQGELTPVVFDASLYWAFSTVEAADVVQFSRFAELLRYTRIQAMERSGDGWALPTEDEKRHWRDVVFDRQQEDEDEEEEAAPGGAQLLCSRCYKLCSGSTAHVIPWWRPDIAQLLTTYRCEQCWLVSLEETRDFVCGPAFDAAARTEFVHFLERHQQASLAADVAGRPHAESIKVLLQFLAQINSQAVVLRP